MQISSIICKSCHPIWRKHRIRCGILSDIGNIQFIRQSRHRKSCLRCSLSLTPSRPQWRLSRRRTLVGPRVSRLAIRGPCSREGSIVVLLIVSCRRLSTCSSGLCTLILLDLEPTFVMFVSSTLTAISMSGISWLTCLIKMSRVRISQRDADQQR